MSFRFRNKRQRSRIGRLETLETRRVLDATLAGFVFVDHNNDGVRDAGESGIPGVLVSLSGTPEGGGDPINLSELTRNDGSYAFHVAAGNYQISQRQPSAMDDGLDSTTIPGANADNDRFTNLVIADGQTFSENNFGEQTLHPEYVGLGWFFTSAPAEHEMFRQSIALGEEHAGDPELAQAIRDASDAPPVQPPTNPNRTPVANNDAFSVDQDAVLTISVASGVLANDSDPDGDSLSAVVVTQPSNGSLTLNANGSFTYTPTSGFSGDDSFQYRADDGTSVSNLATVTLTVNAVQGPNDFTVDENSAVGTLVGGITVEGELGSPVVYERVDPDLAAELRLAPDDHLSGDPAAPVVLIEYFDLSCPHCRDIAPVLKQLEQDFDGDLLVVRRHFLLFNSADNTFLFPNSLAAARAAEAAGLQGKFDEMVEQLFTNQDDWRTVADPSSLFNQYGQAIGLDLVQFDNDRVDPAIDDRINRDRDTAASLGLTSTPSFFLGGTATQNPETLAAFTPLIQSAVDAVDETFALNRRTGEITVADSAALDFETAPEFSFSVDVRDGGTRQVDVTVSLLNVNEFSPTATDDSYTVGEDGTLNVNASQGLLNNDSDDDGDTLSAAVVDQPVNGGVSVNSDGSFNYTPDAGFIGTDSFTYAASDADFSSQATVTITVTAVNDAPVATADSYSVSEDQTLTVDSVNGLLANDTDIDSSAITAQAVDQPSNGTLVLSDDGSFSYTPNANFSGEDTFTYRASDGQLSSELTTVTITVIDQNTFSVPENTAAGTTIGTVTPESFTPGSGTPLMFQVNDASLASELKLNANDHLTGDPAAPVVLIEYFDLSCPHCRDIHPVLQQLKLDFDGDLLVVRRHFLLFNPTTSSFVFPNSLAAARAAEAAALQGKFDEMVDQLFTNQDDWRSANDPSSFFDQYAQAIGLNVNQFHSDQSLASVDDRINQDRDTAASLGLTSTPSFFLNGQTLENPGTLAAFTPVIQSAVDAVDDVFTLNRRTGELSVADSTALDFETTPSFSLPISISGNGDETVTATVNLIDVNEAASGEGESTNATLQSLTDESMASEEDWLF